MSKKPIAWIVDSTAYVSDILAAHPDVHVVPLTIHFGQEQFADGVELTSDELYSRIRNAEEFPKTSQPPAGEFAKLYEKISEDYEAIIAVHISEKLSGTISSSKSGAEIAEIHMECIDSLALSSGITLLVERGLILQERGMNIEEIALKLRSEMKNFRNYILIGNLNQLYKGGRMSGVQFYLGSLLKIKPIIQLTEFGELKAFEKVRSQNKAINYLVDKAVDAYEKDGVRSIDLMHGNVLDQVEDLKKLIQAKVPNLEVRVGEISSVLAVHAGEGTIATLWHVPAE
ncbi:DegV family protein [Paenisporosarcina sp. TG20]|uniref:DegV family protein n=1 Tax=Paenisporosarcina sp. TG20 TaxID=1211706 RepID=UPI0002E76066|nr:DegV family protein [Paenisporosarcina sp. TG20]